MDIKIADLSSAWLERYPVWAWNEDSDGDGIIHPLSFSGDILPDDEIFPLH